MCSLHSCYLREKSFMGVEGSGLFNVIWLKSIHTFTFIVTVFTASASICVSSRNASLYIAVMIFCAQPYLKPCFMCPFYILSTCPSKGLCTALPATMSKLTDKMNFKERIINMLLYLSQDVFSIFGLKRFDNYYTEYLGELKESSEASSHKRIFCYYFLSSCRSKPTSQT